MAEEPSQKLEFVPVQGAGDRSDDAVLEIAAELRKRFTEQDCAAHGSSERLVVLVRGAIEADLIVHAPWSLLRMRSRPTSTPGGAAR